MDESALAVESQPVVKGLPRDAELVGDLTGYAAFLHHEADSVEFEFLGEFTAFKGHWDNSGKGGNCALNPRVNRSEIRTLIPAKWLTMCPNASWSRGSAARSSLDAFFMSTILVDTV